MQTVVESTISSQNLVTTVVPLTFMEHSKTTMKSASRAENVDHFGLTAYRNSKRTTMADRYAFEQLKLFNDEEYRIQNDQDDNTTNKGLSAYETFRWRFTKNS